MKKLGGIILVLLLLIGGYFLFNYVGVSFTDTRERESITIAHGTQSIFGIFYIAEELGFFEDEKLDVTLKPFTSGRDALQAAIDGEVHLSTPFETPVVLQLLNGHDVQVISEIHHSTQNTGMLVHKDFLKPDGSIDLSSKPTIGVSKSTNGEFFLNIFLSSQGLDISSFTIVDIPPPEIVSSVVNRKVDIVATWNPHLDNIIKQSEVGEYKVFFSDEYVETSMIAGLGEVIEEKNEAIQRMVEALVKAEQVFMNDKEKANQIIAQFLGIEESTVNKIRTTNSVELRLSTQALSIIEQELLWFGENKGIDTRVFDIKNVMNKSFLLKAKPESVTLL